MKFRLIHKSAFQVIGKEGSTDEGEGFIKKLYLDLEKHFTDIEPFVKKVKGKVEGQYGLMSDFAYKFKPWEENFTKGLYLAGPVLSSKGLDHDIKGFKVWSVKEQDYFEVELEKDDNYQEVFNHFVYYQIPFEMKTLSGAAFDYYSFSKQKQYILFPVVDNHFKHSTSIKRVQIAKCGLVCSYCFFTSCPGCEKKECKCSYGYYCPDKVCSTVKCCSQKWIKGCYECDKLESCKENYYSMNNKGPKANSVFIKKYGKEALVKTIQKMIDCGLNYSKVIDKVKDYKSGLRILERYYELVK